MKNILLLALFFWGCHPPNNFIYRYRDNPKKWRNFNVGEKYGATVGQLSKDKFWINYNFVYDLHEGNYERKYYLLRCAELTKEKGFEYFMIILENKDMKGNTSDQMVIQCFKNKPLQTGFAELDNITVSYNANLVIESHKYLYNGKLAYKRKNMAKINK